jgi:hypothetical protein
MAIATLDQYIAAVKQRINFLRTAAVTTVAGLPYCLNQATGYPGAASLSLGSANGSIITDATAGFPAIDFSTGNGYLTNVEFGNSVLSRLSIYDLIAVTGPFNWNASAVAVDMTAIVSSLQARCPDYPGSGTAWGKGIIPFVQIITTHTTAATWSCAIAYTDQDGNAGTSGSTMTGAAANLIAGRLLPIPLAAGDSGIQKVTSVTATAGSATAGTFNIILARPLWVSGRVQIAAGGDIHDMLKTGMPTVYNNSALLFVCTADAASSGLPELFVEIASA